MIETFCLWCADKIVDMPPNRQEWSRWVLDARTDCKNISNETNRYYCALPLWWTM